MSDSLLPDSIKPQSALSDESVAPSAISHQPSAASESPREESNLQSQTLARVIETILLIAIIAAGAYLRFVGLDWDTNQHLHPDERFLTMVSSSISSVKSVGDYFDTKKSSLSPYNKGYGFFVYGTAPIFIVRYAGEGVDAIKAWATGDSETMKSIGLMLVGTEKSPGVLRAFGSGYDQVHLTGRALSALFDLVSVYVVFLIGTRLYDRRVGLLASAFYSFSVILIQQAHFFTVDSFANTFVSLAIYFSVRALDETKWRHYFWFGVFFGLSVASKINTAPLALAIVLAAFVVLYRAYKPSAISHQPSAEVLEAQRNKLTQDILLGLVIAGFASLIVFRVAQPYAFDCLGLNPAWLKNMGEIRGQVTGDVDFPPNHQWTNRPAFIFPLENMIKWGMGVPLGVIVWIGFAFAAWQSVR